MSWCVTSTFTRQPILVPNGPAIPVFLGSTLGGVSRTQTGDLKAKAWQLFYPLKIDHKATFDWQNEFLKVHFAVYMCGVYYESSFFLLRLFPPGGVIAQIPECSVLCILRGDPQCLHIPSEAIHPSPSWSFSWHSHVTNCSHFVVFFHSLHVSIPA